MGIIWGLYRDYVGVKGGFSRVYMSYGLNLGWGGPIGLIISDFRIWSSFSFFLGFP